MNPKKHTLDEVINRFGKPDIQRIGVFIEMTYMNGQGYMCPPPKVVKGRGFYSGPSKSKCGTQDSYFADNLNKLFKGEAIPRKPKKKISSKKPKKTKPLYQYPDGRKPISSSGHYCGTFGGVVEAFSPKIRKSRNSEKPVTGIFKTNPSKNGGFGYNDICLSPFPQYKPLGVPRRFQPKWKGELLDGPKERIVSKLRSAEELWVPAGPAKLAAGYQTGVFSKHPKHTSPEVRKVEDMETVQNKLSYSVHSYAVKTMYRNTDLSYTVTNCKSYKPPYTKRVLPPTV